MGSKYSEQFEGQHEGEIIEFVFRQHPVVLRKALIFFLVVFTFSSIPVAFWPLQRWPFYLILVGLLVGALGFLYRFIGWYFSVYIVTNERLIQIRQKGFFDRQVVGIAHNKIQSINYQIRGVQATLFHFGTIVVQMFTGDLVLQYIHHPSRVHKRLTELIRHINPSMPVDIDSNGTDAL
jgi:hypothetical protein